LYDFPLCLNFKWWISHASALPLKINRLFRLASIVCSCYLCLPLLLFLCLLRASKVSLVISFVLLLLDFKLLPLSLCLLRHVDSFLILLGFSLIFYAGKSKVFNVLN
jgi:hypothetical protein